MQKKILIGILLIQLLFAVGGGGGSSGGGSGGGSTQPVYRFNATIGYSCPEEEITVEIGSITSPDGKLDNFEVKIYENGFGIKTDTTDSDGKAKFSIGEGKYDVKISKNKYFKQSIDYEIKECEGKEPEFYCEEGATMKERIKCVLNLPDEHVNQVKYVPEECRAKPTEGKKTQCIQEYKEFQTCRGEGTTDKERETCIKPKLGLSQEVRTTIEGCKQEIGISNRNLCLQNMKINLLALAKFRMYNLVYKAYLLWEHKGADIDKVADFTSIVYQKKIDFNNADTTSKRKEIINELKMEWEKFKQNVKEGIEEKT